MVQSEQLLQRDVRKYDEASEWQLPEPGTFASAKSFRDKVVMPFVNKLKSLIKNSTIQCVRLKEEVLQLRKEKKRLSDDVEFYKGKIKDMSDMTETLLIFFSKLERNFGEVFFLSIRHLYGLLPLEKELKPAIFLLCFLYSQSLI